jgi:hypothetical protein
MWKRRESIKRITFVIIPEIHCHVDTMPISIVGWLCVCVFAARFGSLLSGFKTKRKWWPEIESTRHVDTG